MPLAWKASLGLAAQLKIWIGNVVKPENNPFGS